MRDFVRFAYVESGMNWVALQVDWNLDWLSLVWIWTLAAKGTPAQPFLVAEGQFCCMQCHIAVQSLPHLSNKFQRGWDASHFNSLLQVHNLSTLELEMNLDTLLRLAVYFK